MKYAKIMYNNQQIWVSPDGTSILVNGVEVNQYLMRKQKKGANPFRYVSVKGKSIGVHRLVAMAYVPNPDDYKMVVHMDTNTLNNDYRNLQWGYQRLIAQNMKIMGRSYRTENHFRMHSKIRAKHISKIITRIKQGEPLSHIAKDYDTSAMSIHRVKKKFYANLK